MSVASDFVKRPKAVRFVARKRKKRRFFCANLNSNISNKGKVKLHL